MNISKIMKNKITDEMVDLVFSSNNEEKIKDMIKNGVTGFNNMEMDELIDMYVRNFGIESYKELSNSCYEEIMRNKYHASFDASVDVINNTSYVSYVIRTSDNILVYRNAIKVNVRDSYVGESYALLKLLDKCIELGIKHVNITGDNKMLINTINKRSRRRGFNGYLPTIVNRINKMNYTKIKWVRREKNRYADLLCRIKRREDVDLEKMDSRFNIKELMDISSKISNPNKDIGRDLVEIS